ncbi:putative RNA-directed DNA polymerase [Tanacetum coccineum]
MVIEDDIVKTSDDTKIIGSSFDLSLSFADSLYLHPNDTSGSPIVTIKLTGTENYKMLSIAMKFALRNHNKLDFIDGTCKRDNKNVLFVGAIYAKTAYEMWNDLKETYDKVNGFSIFNIHKSINSLNQNGVSLADYYNNLNSFWKQFDVMISLPPCNCEVVKHFEKHNLLQQLLQFLMGLDDSYFAIRSNILTREPLPSVKVAFAVVSGEEFYVNITSVGTTKPTATAFTAKTFDKKRFNNNFNSNNKGSSANSNSNNKGLDPNLKFINCNKIAYLVDRCFELVGYPVGYVKINFNAYTRLVSSNNASADVHSNSLAILMNLLNENGVSTANANMAGKHFKNIEGNFFNGSVIVGHPNGTQALITKIGDLNINNDITLYYVLVVPEYTVSLLFVHNLSRDNKLFVGFDESNFYIQDLKANRNVGIGKQFNGLYLFDVDNSCKIVSNNCIASCFVFNTLWHQRLGHPADQVVNALKTTLNLDSHSTYNHLYNTCNKAKQTREPFPLSEHKSTKIGELVHLDVWGPYKVISRDGFRYFLIIVDDFSRVVWVYMLKGKGDVYDSIISFVQMMINQFETNVKIFKSYNGTEFINSRLQNFLNEKGILHQTTYVYTPQQNGITERKHRHLLNVARIPSSVPNDEGRVSSNDDGTELSHDIHGNDDSEATSMDINNTHPEGTVPNETDFVNDFYENSEFNSEVEDLPIHTVRRSSSIEPTCYEYAILDNNWIDAMNAEIVALNKNQTWIITDLPANIKAIDFDETFSPVVKMSTVRCLIALSVTNNWHLFQVNVNNAFLYGELDEDVYMIIRQRFANKDNKNKVCKLVKSLYGLKQAPRKWNEKLVTVLKENDFVQSVNDHSLFTKSKNNKFIALLVYVDDIVVTGNLIKTGNDLCLSQRKYCLELLKEYGLLGCKPASTPMEPNFVLPYVATKDDHLL